MLDILHINMLRQKQTIQIFRPLLQISLTVSPVSPWTCMEFVDTHVWDRVQHIWHTETDTNIEQNDTDTPLQNLYQSNTNTYIILTLQVFN